MICDYCGKDASEHSRFYFFAYDDYEAYGGTGDLKNIYNDIDEIGRCTRENCETLYVCDNKICDTKTGVEIEP